MFHVPAHKQLDPAKQPGQIVHQVKAPSADFAFSDHGSICILTALSPEGSRFVREYLDHAQRWAGGVVIEPRFVCDIFDAIAADGLEVA
ncbi:MAG TPA: hypothetical protein PKV98_04240 [Burkholderiaceae bacterium]|nr:hypothetical protein [Burkholderiaceae bacterium]